MMDEERGDERSEGRNQGIKRKSYCCARQKRVNHNREIKHWAEWADCPCAPRQVHILAVDVAGGAGGGGGATSVQPEEQRWPLLAQCGCVPVDPAG